jgi:hypothetical protein
MQYLLGPYLHPAQERVIRAILHGAEDESQLGQLPAMYPITQDEYLEWVLLSSIPERVDLARQVLYSSMRSVFNRDRDFANWFHCHEEYVDIDLR